MCKRAQICARARTHTHTPARPSTLNLYEGLSTLSASPLSHLDGEGALVRLAGHQLMQPHQRHPGVCMLKGGATCECDRVCEHV